ncbi:alpha-amylase family glycosyl hydrolase [Algoriphagus formosus]|uniref:Alpha-amylase n=1 Tax=Algoriphagus formosus TaxID=2007308 RepID=A0A4R5US32_9BACT|nr:alpha-amylase family glycosyl hydrolase [Algoriphagus aquimaris]TDK41766.1 alpha-amylase [Algoriphagus aquimaris]
MIIEVGNKDYKSIAGEFGISGSGKHAEFWKRLELGYENLRQLYFSIYGHLEDAEVKFQDLLRSIISAYLSRSADLKKRDLSKKPDWFLSNDLVGMSLYVDRFAGSIAQMEGKLAYMDELGVNFLHLMPLFESPQGESDGGYAVSDFRKVDERFGTLEELSSLRKKMHDEGMYLMLDIVLNHTSHRHEWAEKAKSGEKKYQDYFYMYDNRWIPNQFEAAMPEIFPESSPGNFTWSEDCQKWVMTVFHNYQWDLNYRNPEVLREMLDNILFYANLGVDLIRIDAPAFIWKETGTSCQNLPQAHSLLQLIKQAVQIASPGMAILGEAIVAPNFIMEYFGKGDRAGKECDFAYNATQMALQWDMLASGDTRVMLEAQPILQQKPQGTSWISYTRCHDDIGLGYDDWMISKAGKDPYMHRSFLKNYFSGSFPGSPSRGALFSSNPKTGDARISGSLASLCGLEAALYAKDAYQVALSIQKILLMQAFSIFQGGLPMLYYGDELGYLNDYTFQHDPAKSYDNRWMHRPINDWEKAAERHTEGTVEERVFSGLKQLIQIRKSLPAISDNSNIRWMNPHNIHVAGFLREKEDQRIFVVGNYSDKASFLTWYAFKEFGFSPKKLWDHVSKEELSVASDDQYLILEPYGFRILEVLS